jgi:hypothetical protein
LRAIICKEIKGRAERTPRPAVGVTAESFANCCDRSALVCVLVHPASQSDETTPMGEGERHNPSAFDMVAFVE